MSIFQIIMFAATLFFAYQIYRHVQSLEDRAPDIPHTFEEENSPLSASQDLIDQADEAYEKGDLFAAREMLKSGAEHDQRNPEILNRLAFITAKEGDVTGGIELYKRSLLVNENDDLVHNALASLYRTQGEFGLAQNHYEKALLIDDQYPQTYYNYGNLLTDMGDVLKAEEMYRQALALDSNFSEAREALKALQGNV